ncbi:MAG: DUF5698 domain-containing protein [Oscillospiraceae bacterium]|nr:DUF5698 domain-containing protein [Oscillospiraceae bacterium]
MIEFFSGMPEIVFCLVIFVCKVCEIIIQSLKTVFLVKGNKTIATVLALVEVLIWAFVISGLISELSKNLFWLFAYCLGYGAGFYLGSTIESMLAIGTMDVMMIVPAEYTERVEEYLIKKGSGYFIETCRGSKGEHAKIDVILPRKAAKEIRRAVAEICENNIFVTNYDVSYMRGGYAAKLKTRARGH